MKKIKYSNFFIFIFLLFILYQDSFCSLIKINILNYVDEIFVLLIFFIAIIKSKGKIKSEVIKILGHMLIFYFVGVGSCLLNSDYKIINLLIASFLPIKFLLLVSSIILLKPDEKAANTLIKYIKFLGWVSLFGGIINFLFPQAWIDIIPYTYLYIRNNLNSVMGLFVHAGIYGWFLVFVGILYLMEFNKSNNKINIFKSVLFFVGALLSLKVKVMLSFLAVTIFYELFIKKRKISMSKLIIPITTIFIVIFLFGNQIKETYEIYLTSNDGQTSARYALYSGSINIMKDYFPVGVGFGKFGSYYAIVDYSEYYYIYNCSDIYGLKPNEAIFGTDTFWPSIFGETGVIGTLSYIMALIFLFKLYFKELMKKDISINQRYYIGIGLLIFIQAIIESFGEPIFNSSPQNIYIGLLVGYCISRVKGEKNEK